MEQNVHKHMVLSHRNAYFFLSLLFEYLRGGECTKKDTNLGAKITVKDKFVFLDCA